MQVGDLKPLGVWTWLDHLSAGEAAEFANQLEEWGYGALWIPEAVGRDPFSLIGYLAAKTERLILATGIANIYARDPMTMRAVQETLGEASNDRFLMGLGVSHAHLVAGVRKHEYGKPVSTMRDYLDRMESAIYMGRKPETPAPIVLALRCARTCWGGLVRATRRRAPIPTSTTPRPHGVKAREILGEDGWLCPELMVLRETDATGRRARSPATT